MKNGDGLERGAYDPTQDEIKELRHALHQIGEAVLLTDEELGQEWIRYAKRVVRYEYRKFRANCGDPQSPPKKPMHDRSDPEGGIPGRQL